MTRKMLTGISVALTVFALVGQAESFSAPANFMGGFPRSRARGLTASSARSNDYTENYITIIEDKSCHPPGYFVASTDHNYVILSPLLKPKGWHSISLNGDHVFVIRSDNTTLNQRLSWMTLAERDYIAELRGNFLQNLAGLKFAFYTSGSSLSLDSRRHQENARSLSRGMEGLRIRQPKKRYRRSENSTVVRPAIEDERPVNGSGLANLTTRRSLGSPAQPVCSTLVADTNYYNLIGSPLNASLAGDVYFFDFRCNVLDVYSSTVSLRRISESSILYRDKDYFAYSSSKLSQSINRIFLAGDVVVFIYNDGTVVAKQNWMLNLFELNTIVNVRKELQSICDWQSRASKLYGHNSKDRTTAPPKSEAVKESEKVMINNAHGH